LVVRKSKHKSKNRARREEHDFDQTAFTRFQKATGIKQSKTRRSVHRDLSEPNPAAEVYAQSTQRKSFCNLTLVCPMNWKNLSWAIRRSPQLNKRHRAEGGFLAAVKFSVDR